MILYDSCGKWDWILVSGNDTMNAVAQSKKEVKKTIIFTLKKQFYVIIKYRIVEVKICSVKNVETK